MKTSGGEALSLRGPLLLVAKPRGPLPTSTIDPPSGDLEWLCALSTPPPEASASTQVPPDITSLRDIGDHGCNA